MSHRLVGADSEAECLTLPRIRCADFDRFTRQANESRSSQYPHLIESGREPSGRVVPFGQNLDITWRVPPSHRQAAHIRYMPDLSRTPHGDDLIAVKGEYHIGDGAIDEELLLPWAWLSRQGHEPLPREGTV